MLLFGGFYIGLIGLLILYVSSPKFSLGAELKLLRASPYDVSAISVVA